MRTRFYSRGKSGYYTGGTDSKRLLSMSLQTGNSRRKGLPELDDGIKKRRLIFYGIAGALFCIGLLFVLF